MHDILLFNNYVKSITIPKKLGKTCQVCGKEGLAADIMRHIEAHHVEGVEIPCNHCEKIFSSRKKMHDHFSKYHTQQ